MPEEINRLITDAIADYLLTPSPDGDENLRNEGAGEDRIKFVGNVMIDSLLKNLERAKTSTIHSDLQIEKGNYGVLTLHRPSNVDNKESFSGIIGALEELAIDYHWFSHFTPGQRIGRRNLDFWKDLNQS